MLFLIVGCAPKPTVEKDDGTVAGGTQPTGNPAPMLVVDETYNWDGPIDLADFAGKVVVLDFWTYW